MNKRELAEKINSSEAAKVFTELYGNGGIEPARRRYKTLLEAVRDENDLRIFTAPGRTELAGNHTDHNGGKVLAASIQLDNVAVASPRQDNTVFFRSKGYPDVTVHLADAENTAAVCPDEKGKTEALVRGIAAGIQNRGGTTGGFSAYADSTVLPGSGLSSSAAVEALFARIFDCLYADGKRSALHIAQIGQFAENVYFGKPCGLMDQIACASGGAVAIDFAGTPDANPRIKRVNFDLASQGYTLCVVNTGGSHADLTPEYAAIPTEMKRAAAFFGKSVLAEIDRETVLAAVPDLRKAVGDRAMLRTLHFFDENERVEQMTAALETLDKVLDAQEKQHALFCYLKLVNESGDSSWELLQNVAPAGRPETQAVGIALALSRDFFLREHIQGACRIHGGGFAGTIQAYIPHDILAAYRARMETVFGANAVTELRIRSRGAVEIFF